MIKHWTPEEEQILITRKTERVKLKDIAVELGRTLEAVRTRSKRVGARLGTNTNPGNSSWSTEEVATLYENLDYEELSDLLGRTKKSIQSKCEKLGISKRFADIGRTSGTQNKNLETTLYLVDFGDFKKVGITQVPIEERLKGYKSYKILDSVVMSYEDAFDTEGEILKNMREFRVIGDIRRGGSEYFDYACTQLEDLI